MLQLAWLYNPTDVFTTWRLLRGNMITPGSIIRCLLFFAEVPPLGKLPIPFAFLPTEMIKYEVVSAVVIFTIVEWILFYITLNLGDYSCRSSSCAHLVMKR